MVDLVVSPKDFAPTKVGYKQYLKAGGGMQLADFQVFERRTKKQVLADNINRVYNAMNYHYDMFFYYKNIGELETSTMHWQSMEIRANQLSEYHKQLSLLDN